MCASKIGMRPGVGEGVGLGVGVGDADGVGDGEGVGVAVGDVATGAQADARTSSAASKPRAMTQGSHDPFGTSCADVSEGG